MTHRLHVCDALANRLDLYSGSDVGLLSSSGIEGTYDTTTFVSKNSREYTLWVLSAAGVLIAVPRAEWFGEMS